MSHPPPSLVEHFTYRPEVDGLRAVAVLAVLLFHAGLGFPGGYVGVDVFFVISGYLITSLVVKELEAGTFTLAGFYERRARRIVPALVVVVLATLVVGWWVLLPADYAELGKSAIWQAFGAANFHFWGATGYFEGAAAEKPLLHTWSLAVEEQFYLVVPVLLLSLFRIPGGFRRRILVPLFAVGILVGLAYSAHDVTEHPSAAFYLLPSRSWELLLGSTLAIVPTAWMAGRRLVQELLSALGLVGVLVPCFIYTRETPFPGLAAIPPCLGAFLFIGANSRDAEGKVCTATGRLLATKPIVFVGLISYSLYLWHWPIFAFSSYLTFQLLSLKHRLGLAVLGIFLATLSWRFVETPFRRRIVCGSRKRIFGFAATSMATCLILGGAVYFTSGMPGRLPAALMAGFPDEANGAMMVGKELTADDIRAGRLVPFGNQDPSNASSILIWGDSHAVAALPAFDELFKRWGLRGCAATHNSTPPLVNLFARTEYGLNEQSIEFNNEVIAYVEKQRIPNIVLICAWDGYASLLEQLVDHSTRYEPVHGLETLKTGLVRTVEELKRRGSQPWVVLQAPRQPNAKKVVRAIYNGLDERDYCTTPDTWHCVAGDDNAFLKRLEAAGARIIDPRASFLDEERNVYRIWKNGISLYRDDHHLSSRGAVITLVPLLEASFESFHASRETLTR